MTARGQNDHMPLDIATVCIALILFLAALSRSTFGFGDALIAMPLLSFLIDIKMATPLVALVSATIAIAIVVRDWRQIDIKSARRLAISAMFGIPIGLLYLTQVEERVVKGVLAVVVIGFASFRLWKPRPSWLLHERWSYLAGWIAGILGGAYNTHGPTLLIYGTLRQWSPETLRATLQGYFVLAGVFLLASHCVAGLWNADLFIFFGISLPAVFLGIALGRKLNRRFRDERFSRVVCWLLMLIGVALLIDTTRL